MKSINITHLTHGQLGNHNAGEGGGNISTLKRYNNRPYISGQSYRHAIRSALRSAVASGDVRCVPKHACGNIEKCKSCDLFGYMRPDSDLDYPKRMSPLSVTPLLGVYDTDVVADLILQYDVDSSENKLAHREMAENVYRGSISIDIDAIGRREVETVDSDAADGAEYTREFKEYENVDRAERVTDTLMAIQHAVKFAGQSRHMADFMPDLLAVSTHNRHTHRLANALHVDPQTGELDIRIFESTLRDMTAMDGDVWVAGSFNPVVIQNWDAIEDIAGALEGVKFVGSITECFDEVRTEVKNNVIDTAAD